MSRMIVEAAASPATVEASIIRVIARPWRSVGRARLAPAGGRRAAACRVCGGGVRRWRQGGVREGAGGEAGAAAAAAAVAARGGRRLVAGGRAARGDPGLHGSHLLVLE